MTRDWFFDCQDITRLPGEQSAALRPAQTRSRQDLEMTGLYRRGGRPRALRRVLRLLMRVEMACGGRCEEYPPHKKSDWNSSLFEGCFFASEIKATAAW